MTYPRVVSVQKKKVLKAQSLNVDDKFLCSAKCQYWQPSIYWFILESGKSKESL